MEGRSYKQLVYHFVLAYSNWEWVRIAHSETFEALVEGLQESLSVLGSLPREHRTDNLSAAGSSSSLPNWGTGSCTALRA